MAGTAAGAVLVHRTAAQSRTPTAPMPSDLTTLTLTEAAEAVRTKRVSPTELVKACLARIDIYNPKLNAFITVTREAALKQAAALEADLKAGTIRGPLHGVPIALKDNTIPPASAPRRRAASTTIACPAKTRMWHAGWPRRAPS